ncbi:unnamed protein product [Bursaphelenchus okinawaensis]|uniref:Uncharacterized protein n=1 Tax=Bursaphelenchus okinawaensis TaxID=465554 RepID=A0A811KC84_9BILA|nr:unnamed protein product [Bursaphelenchus okinawaensis]CAG9099133.1 unnamed protein product [Bursaphelenchus okinawaensis]
MTENCIYIKKFDNDDVIIDTDDEVLILGDELKHKEKSPKNDCDRRSRKHHKFLKMLKNESQGDEPCSGANVVDLCVPCKSEDGRRSRIGSKKEIGGRHSRLGRHHGGLGHHHGGLGAHHGGPGGLHGGPGDRHGGPGGLHGGPGGHDGGVGAHHGGLGRPHSAIGGHRSRSGSRSGHGKIGGHHGGLGARHGGLGAPHCGIGARPQYFLGKHHGGLGGYQTVFEDNYDGFRLLCSKKKMLEDLHREMKKSKAHHGEDKQADSEMHQELKKLKEGHGKLGRHHGGDGAHHGMLGRHHGRFGGLHGGLGGPHGGLGGPQGGLGGPHSGLGGPHGGLGGPQGGLGGPHSGLGGPHGGHGGHHGGPGRHHGIAMSNMLESYHSKFGVPSLFVANTGPGLTIQPQVSSTESSFKRRASESLSKNDQHGQGATESPSKDGQYGKGASESPFKHGHHGRRASESSPQRRLQEVHVPPCPYFGLQDSSLLPSKDGKCNKKLLKQYLKRQLAKTAGEKPEGMLHGVKDKLQKKQKVGVGKKEALKNLFLKMEKLAKKLENVQQELYHVAEQGKQEEVSPAQKSPAKCSQNVTFCPAEDFEVIIVDDHNVQEEEPMDQNNRIEDQEEAQPVVNDGQRGQEEEQSFDEDDEFEGVLVNVGPSDGKSDKKLTSEGKSTSEAKSSSDAKSTSEAKSTGNVEEEQVSVPQQSFSTKEDYRKWLNDQLEIMRKDQ